MLLCPRCYNQVMSHKALQIWLPLLADIRNKMEQNSLDNQQLLRAWECSSKLAILYHFDRENLLPEMADKFSFEF
jgi:hypothetical protein